MIVALMIAAQAVTLDAVVAEALEKNEDAEAAQLVVARAEASRREAWAELFGDLSVTGTYRRRAFEIPAPGTSGGFISRFNALSGVARAEITVLDATAISRISKAGADVESAQARNLELRRVLAFSAAELYLSVLAAERAKDAAERRLALADEAYANVKARFDAGLTAKSVLNRSRLERATAQLEATRADNAAQQMRLSLSFVVGRPVTGVLEEPNAAPPAGTDADLLAAARIDRPDLKRLELELEARRIAGREPWFGFIPNVGVAAELTATNETGFAGQTFNWSLAATAEWLLWDGGVRYAVARRRAAETREAELAVAKQMRQVELELRQARTALSTAMAAVEQAEARLEVARENAEEVRERFTQGLATALEQADAAVAEYDSAQALASERFEAGAASFRLVRAIGGWPTDAR